MTVPPYNCGMSESRVRAVSVPLAAARSASILSDIGATLACSAFIALLSRVAINLPFSPVPVTGQTLGVLLTGAVLGSRRGAASVLAYIALGISGLPVFALGAGPAYLLGPTGGYLAGFVLAAWLSGFIAEQRWGRRIPGTLLALIAGNLAVYVGGLIWLSRFAGWSRVLPLGLYPFIPGDSCKLLIAALSLPVGWSLTRRHHSTTR